MWVDELILKLVYKCNFNEVNDTKTRLYLNFYHDLGSCLINRWNKLILREIIFLKQIDVVLNVFP